MPVASRRRTLALRLALSVTLFLLTAVGLETVYRLRLFSRDVHELIAASGFFAYNDNIVKYLPSRRYGYEYNRAESARTYVRNGRVVRCTEDDPYPVNSEGNPGAEPRDYRSASRRILFFGDSFSAFSEQGRAYPNRVEDRLGKQLGQPVSVVNFSRAGYGVLQAFDLARDKIEQLDPDLAVFAFIAADFARARFWVKRDDGPEAVIHFGTTDPDDRHYDPARHRVYHSSRFPRLSVEWCRGQLERPDPEDELLRQLIAERQRLLRDSYHYAHLARAGLWDPRRSYLWNRLVHRNAFHRAGVESGFEISFETYDQDATFVDAVDAIRRLGVPVALVYLPSPGEIRRGGMNLGERAGRLRQSLEKLLGVPMQDLSASATRASEETLKRFWVPHDGHPSSYGLDYYAEATTEALIPLLAEE